MLTQERKQELLDTENQYKQWIYRYEEDTVERWEEEQAFEKQLDSLTDEEMDYLGDIHERMEKARYEIMKKIAVSIKRNNSLKAMYKNSRSNDCDR